MNDTSKAPILKTINDVVLPLNGLGNPKLHITVQHPNTCEDIKLLVSSTVLHLIPQYADKLFDYNRTRDLWL